MPNFGPEWQAAQHNLLYYVSFFVAPAATFIGVIQPTKVRYWVCVALAAVATFAASYYAVEWTWQTRASIAATASERAVIAAVEQSGGADAVTAATLTTIIFATVWALVGRLLWYLVEEQKLPWRIPKLPAQKPVQSPSV